MRRQQVKFRPGDLVRVKHQYLTSIEQDELAVVLKANNQTEKMELFYFVGRGIGYRHTDVYYYHENMECFDKYDD